MCMCLLYNIKAKMARGIAIFFSKQCKFYENVPPFAHKSTTCGFSPLSPFLKYLQKALDKQAFAWYNNFRLTEKSPKGIAIWLNEKEYYEVWLSLVERYVRDVEAASSNLVTSTKIRKGRLALPFLIFD